MNCAFTELQLTSLFFVFCIFSVVNLMHQSTTPQTAQLAKLSHMSQLPATTFLHTSGGSLLIRRRSRDQQAHAAIAPATGGSVGYPIVRTRSCPADAEHGPFESENESERDHENENESENESGNESASSTSSSSSSTTTAAKSSDAVRTRPGAHKLKFQDQQYKNKRKGTTIAHHHLVHAISSKRPKFQIFENCHWWVAHIISLSPSPDYSRKTHRALLQRL
jgi:hypothetical protein